MAKTRITLTQKPTFPAPVAIPIPGEKPDVVVFTFKARTRKEFAEWMEALKEKNNVEAIMECVTGWALDDPFHVGKRGAIQRALFGRCRRHSGQIHR
jgi:hypothetical protein